MLRRLWLSLRRDHQINLRNYYYLVTIAVALIYLALIRWLIPADLSLKPALYVLDETADGRYAAYVLEQAAANPYAGPATLAGSVEELQAALEANQNSVGIALADAAPLPAVTLYFQSYMNPQVRNLMAVAVEDSLREAYGRPWPVAQELPRETLRGQGQAPVPFNLALTPFLLFSDTALIGLLFIAALIFMEKEEGALGAYLVTPGRIWEYIVSKALNLALLAVIFTLVLTLPTLGLRPNYLHLLAVMAMGSIFASLLGAWVAVYFDNLTQFLFPAVALMLVISLPAVAYFVPSFAPFWPQLLPTYALIFGLREAAFPTGSPEIVGSALLILLVANLALLAVSSYAFRRQIARA